MATIPKNVKLSATPQAIAKAVLGDNPEVFANPPVIADTSESVKALGDYIFTYSARQNAFLNALVNRIGYVLITSKLYDNPLRQFKKGILEFGEKIEEIFVDLAKPFQFDPEKAETDIFKREIPDVKAAYHTLNFQKFYKVTISNDELRQAFLSWQGIDNLIARIVDTLYTSLNYDEYLVTKYMIAINALNGHMATTTIAALDKANADDFSIEARSVSNLLVEMSTKYNYAGVHTYTNKDDQYLFLTARGSAVIDVGSLAVAFNMDKAEFMGHTVVINSFSDIDSDRLALLFASDPNYRPLTDDEVGQLDKIGAVLVDRDWFMIFDHYINMTEQYNGEGLYWNYWLHAWRTFSVSPFANAVVFTMETPVVNSVTVSPATATATKGQQVQLNAVVDASGFANKAVTWSSSSELTTVSPSGLVTIGGTETASTVTITATSVFDNTKSGSSVITVTP